MLNHPTLDLLRDLGLHGMEKGFRDMADNPETQSLGHAEWLAILLERESTLRHQKRFESRAKTAKLRHLAAVEDVDYRTPRGLDRTMFLKLAGCDWIRERRHCLLTGPAGVGKSWLACALGYKACRENLSVLYQRVPRLFAALAAAAPDERALTRVIEEAMFEHDATWLGDWAGGTTCRRCGAIDTSTTAHLAQSAAAAATAWFAARPAPVVSGEAVARAMRSAIDRDYVEVFYDLDEAQGYSSVDDLIETVSERIATALTVADEGRAGA